MQAEMEAKMKALQAEVEAKKNDEEAKKEAEEREARLRIEMEQKLESDRIAAQKAETERLERIAREEALLRQRQAANDQLNRQIGELLPAVREANIIATEFKRKIVFNAFLDTEPVEEGPITDAKKFFALKVDNHEDGYFYVWDVNKFTTRLDIMRNMLNEFFDTQEMPNFADKACDPFWDEAEPILIGTSHFTLQSLAYALDNEADQFIFNLSSASASDEGMVGKLKVRYAPCDPSGDEENIEDDLLVEQPEELLGKEMYFKVVITSAAGLPIDLCKNTFVQYKLRYETGLKHQTEIVEGKTPNPVYQYEKIHRIDQINDYILEYFKKGKLVFQVYGNPQFGGQVKNTASAPSASPSKKQPASAAPASSTKKPETIAAAAANTPKTTSNEQ